MSVRLTAIASLNSRVSTTVQYLNNSEAAIGLGADGTYTADLTTKYISTATTVAGALKALDSELGSLSLNYATKEYVDTAVSNLVNSAPLILDTLSEIADALGNDPSLANTLSTTIGNERSRAINAENALISSLSGEVTRATDAETSLTSTLNAEIARATSAETTLSTSIATEITRATSAENTLSTILGNEVINRTEAISTLNSSSDTLLTNLSTTLYTAITAEETRAVAAEGTLAAAIAAEETRAVAAEGTLTTNLNNEIARAGAYESTLSTSLDTEVTRATNAENALDLRVSTVEGTYIKKDGSVAFTGNVNLNNYIITNVSTPTANTDASNKLYVDERVSSLGSVFEYVGTVDPTTSASTLTSLAQQDVGDYYRITAKGVLHYVSSSVVVPIYANAGDGIVKNAGGNWDLIDNTDPVVNGTNARVDVTGNGYDGYVVDINNGYVGQASITTVGTVTSGVWNASVVGTAYGGSGQSAYAEGDILYGSGSSLAKLSVGSNGTILRSVSGAPAWVVADTANVALTDATNFSTSTTLQQSLDYLYNFSQIRKLAQHSIASSTAYSSPTVPNSNLLAGKVNFINYDAANTNIYMPPSDAGLANGTVFRIVHNGTFGDNNYIVKYRDTATETDVDVLELAPKDSIALVWNSASSSYLHAVGI